MNPLNTILVKTIPLFPKGFVKLFANRYIAGETLEQEVSTVKALNSKKIMATMDVLGESIKNKEEAIKAKNEALQVLEAIEKHKLDANLSVKLTMFGLAMDYDFCKGLFTEILDFANSLGVFVRIDMEDSPVTDITIKMYKEMRKNYERVGLVIQAYLRRSYNDVYKLTEEKSNFRLCKGIYIEPESLAYKKKEEIRENFLKLLNLMLDRKAYVGIATHDDYLTMNSENMLKDYGLGREQYEFQMLLGVREWLRDQLAERNHRMRIYVPYGERWYEYSVRRFKENPNVAGHVLKSLIGIR